MPDAPARFDPIWDALPEHDPARYPTTQGNRYLLPCHLLHHGGLYEYVLLDVEQARRWLLAGPCRSFLTHPFLNRAFEDVIGLYPPPPCRGRLPVLDYHDDALIFVLEGYETLPDLKRGDSRRVRELVAEERYTMGLLRRLA